MPHPHVISNEHSEEKSCSITHVGYKRVITRFLTTVRNDMMVTALALSQVPFLRQE
jgi:hypothetical protein